MLMPDIERYLELRRALGYKLETTEFLLRDLARFARGRGDTHVVSHTATEWAAQTTTARQSHRRLTVIIGLARFLRAEDPRHQIPPRPLCRPQPPRPLPYILTAEEIQLLVQAARARSPRLVATVHLQHSVRLAGGEWTAHLGGPRTAAG